MNKPVAWMAKKECQNGLDDFFEHSEDYPEWQIEEFKESYIPLYTHPVKELTDEEIKKYVKEWELKELKENSASTNYVQELAFIDGLTWLLRKAQEK